MSDEKKLSDLTRDFLQKTLETGVKDGLLTENQVELLGTLTGIHVVLLQNGE